MNRVRSLTIEIVVRDYERMIRGIIRKFSLHDTTEDDLFSEILLVMITPSEKMKTNYLERYDPDRAMASTYLARLAFNFMRGHYRKARRNAKHMLITHSMDDKIEAGDGSHRLRDVVPARTDDYLDNDDAILRREIKAELHQEKYRHSSSRNADGKPRSTFRVCMLIMLKDLKVKEVAEIMGISATEVRRRLYLLRENPVFRQMAEDRGFKLPEGRQRFKSSGTY